MTSRVPAWLLVVGLFVAFTLGIVCSGALPTGGSEHDHGATSGEAWTCSMHPQIRQPEPGDCPICGMDLIPVSQVRDDAGGRVVLSDRARQLAQLRTTPVRRQGTASGELRLLGRVEPDESTRKAVTSWVGGRIDRLSVATTGERVRAGQVVATLYSPEVLTAHQDLLSAQKQAARLASGNDVASGAALAAVQAARDRLRLLGVPEAEVQRMADASAPTEAVAIRSPYSGTVIERVATEGSYVKTGEPLYRLAELDQLWIQLDAYESDLSRVAVGQEVSIQVEALPGASFEGRVAFVDPTIDPTRRTARVRVEVDNADGALRPGMFAEATVFTGGPDDAPLVIPASAPLFTGKRSVVYVEKHGETGLGYEPRTVRLGPRLGEVYPVVAGLSEGERVVSRGAFALDADLQIQGGPSMMSLPDDASEGPFADVVQLPVEEQEKLSPLVRAYLDVQRALAEDDHPAAAAAAQQILDALPDVSLSRGEEAWVELSDTLRSHAQHVARSSDIEGARAGFEPLSAGIQTLLRTFGNPTDADLHVAYCPMAHDNRGASWVQTGETIDNAYFGASMRRCGEITSEIGPGSYLPGGQ